MQVADDNRVREVSKPLFGNAYRLELLAIIGDFDGPFYARQIAMQMGVADNLVTSQLGRLCELGLLEKRAASPHMLYTRHPSGVWEMAKQLRVEFGGESQEQRDRTTGVRRRVPSDLGALLNALSELSFDERWNALLNALSELSFDERKHVEDQLESLTPAELRVLGRIELWRTSERRRLRERVRAAIIPGLEELVDPSADPADLITLAQVQARRLRAELEDADEPVELGDISPTILRVREEEREIVRGHLHDTALQILEFIAGDGFGAGLSSAKIARLAGGAARDLDRWIDAIDEPAAVQVLPELQQVTAEARLLDSRAEPVRSVQPEFRTEVAVAEVMVTGVLSGTAWPQGGGSVAIGDVHRLSCDQALELADALLLVVTQMDIVAEERNSATANAARDRED